jgi:hypothetical protein
MNKEVQSRRRFLKTAAGTAIATDLAAKAGKVAHAGTAPIQAGVAQDSPANGGADEPWRRSYMGLPNIVGDANGAPIYAYGRVFVYGVSPDFETGIVLQQGAEDGQKKIRPKKSWEMSENHCGSMVSYQPREPRNDFQPTLAANLIDGDPNTFWMTRGESQTDVMPAWVRIDLAAEEKLRQIVLHPVKRDGGAWPRELTVKISQDAWHWTTVYQGDPSAQLGKDEPLLVQLPEPKSAKQIWIVANQLPVIRFSSVSAECRLALSGVEVLDDKGENVALISRGAGVTVSSTFTGVGSTWDVCDQMWPVQYDLGATWMRLSGGNTPEDYDTLLWRFSEREPGKYIGDEKTRKAMAEATANGCKIDVQLTFGNWLYAPQPKPEYARWQNGKYPYPEPPGPFSRSGFEGYKNWARFMATYYKGTVAYWEIQNECSSGWGWELIKDPDERLRTYCKLVKEVVPIIREADPRSKINLAGLAGPPAAKPSGLPSPEWQSKAVGDWLYKCLDEGIGPLVDAIGWHIQGSVVPGTPYWDEYPEAVRAVKKYAESKGFRGKYLASEYWHGAPYPIDPQYGGQQFDFHPDPSDPLKGKPEVTEVRKAKDTARVFVMNAGLDVVTCWCNTWIQIPLNDGGLFRNGFAADPICPTQPSPTYYVLRTICTVLDGAKPADLQVEFSNKDQKLESYGFELPNGGLMVGAWLPGRSVDKHPGIITDVTLNAPKCSKATGIDTLNGVEQELSSRIEAGRLVIPGVVIHDYPMMLRLHV